MLRARPKFLQEGPEVTLHHASRGLTLIGEVPQSLCTTWPNPFVHTRLLHLCHSLRRYRASRREPFGSLSFTQTAVGTAVFHTFATAASEARATQPATQAVLRLSTA